jgi:hypothetical protein
MKMLRIFYSVTAYNPTTFLSFGLILGGKSVYIILSILAAAASLWRAPGTDLEKQKQNSILPPPDSNPGLHDCTRARYYR